MGDATAERKQRAESCTSGGLAYSQESSDDIYIRQGNISLFLPVSPAVLPVRPGGERSRSPFSSGSTDSQSHSHSSVNYFPPPQEWSFSRSLHLLRPKHAADLSSPCQSSRALHRPLYLSLPAPPRP
eukprot:scaffold121314_cov24-Tisochrysis_lutea.AAC.1